jgi:ketopantoate reductase
MKKSVVIIGIGEIGGVFARGFLKLGHPVFPVNRNTDMDQAAGEFPEPELVMLAVGEKDLHPTLEKIPTAWRDKLVLIQNELLPRDWAQHGLEQPTVISVWFEKKPGMDAKVVVPSPVYGPHARTIIQALEAVQLPAYEVDTPEQLLFELVRKNLYILTTNIGGLKVGGNVTTLWQDNRNVAKAVANDVLTIQEYLTGQSLDRDALIAAMVEAFDGDPEHGCMGRSAPARLQRALEIANKAGLQVPALQDIQNSPG